MLIVFKAPFMLEVVAAEGSVGLSLQISNTNMENSNI
jgi:Trk-type K+ transport system membrane component